jgi:hypothetical protein
MAHRKDGRLLLPLRQQWIFATDPSFVPFPDKSFRIQHDDALSSSSLVDLPHRHCGATRVCLLAPVNLKLNRPEGSFNAAPLAKVILTTFLYISPVQTMPRWEKTGVPGDVALAHFHPSTISGSALWMIARTFASVFLGSTVTCNLGWIGNGKPTSRYLSPSMNNSVMATIEKSRTTRH